MGWVNDLIRSFFWGIGSLALGISDAIFDIFKTITGINITDYENVWYWWSLLWAFGILFVVIRVGTMYIKGLMSEENRERYPMTTIVARIIPMLVVVGLLPTLVSYFNQGSAYFTSQASAFVGASPDVKFSDLIISATSYSGSVDEAINQTGVEETEIVYTLEDVNIDINAKVEGDSDQYKFFPTYSSFFLGIIAGIGSGILLVMLAIEFMKRLISILMKIFISPIPISSIVDPTSSLFGKWVRSLVGDWVTNFVQVLMLYVVLLMVMSNFIGQFGPFVQLIGMFAGLYAVLQGVPQLAEFIGGDLSTGGALQQLSNIRLGGGMLAGGAIAIGGAAAGAGLTALSMGGHQAIKAGNRALAGFTGMPTGLQPASVRSMASQMTGSNTQQAGQSVPNLLSQSSKSKGESAGSGGSQYLGQSRVGRSIAALDQMMAGRVAESAPVTKMSGIQSRVRSAFDQASPQGFNQAPSQASSFSSQASQGLSNPSSSQAFSRATMSSPGQTGESFEPSESSQFSEVEMNQPMSQAYYDREPVSQALQQQSQPSSPLNPTHEPKPVIRRYNASGQLKSPRKASWKPNHEG